MNSLQNWSEPEHRDPSIPADPHSGAIPLRDEIAGKLLQSIVARAQEPGAIVALIWIRSLLNNASRQSLILQEYGEEIGHSKLQVSTAKDWQGWSFSVAMKNAGLTQEEAEQHQAPFREYWLKLIFTSEYCLHDTETLGASLFVQRVLSSRSTRGVRYRASRGHEIGNPSEF